MWSHRSKARVAVNSHRSEAMIAVGSHRSKAKARIAVGSRRSEARIAVGSRGSKARIAVEFHRSKARIAVEFRRSKARVSAEFHRCKAWVAAKNQRSRARVAASFQHNTANPAAGIPRGAKWTVVGSQRKETGTQTAKKNCSKSPNKQAEFAPAFPFSVQADPDGLTFEVKAAEVFWNKEEETSVGSPRNRTRAEISLAPWRVVSVQLQKDCFQELLSRLLYSATEASEACPRLAVAEREAERCKTAVSLAFSPYAAGR